jgi:hypothetical protein
MKGDFTRSTFKKKKHFHDVRMQQGRVQLDADWNEQLDITAHRVETETKDVVGLCGTPMHHGGFRIVVDPKNLTDEEKALPENQDSASLSVLPYNFYISGGRCYVDGILCENEYIVPFTNQPDLPLSKISKIEFSKGIYLAYLDVWLRHITALEDDHIREKALGGPDTATRSKTIWQVKFLRVGNVGAAVNCLSELPVWNALVAPVTGMLAAFAEEAEDEDKPCILSPEGGYRRLENQLYRVEIHKGGELANMTFKWSRDNGSIVTKWEEQDVDKLTVSSTGRDEVLNFAKGQWVELTDDTRELLGKPGILVQLEEVEGRVLTIDSTNAIYPDGLTSVDITDFTNNPKVRRWDSLGEISVDTPGPGIELEDGVMVKFSTGTYKTGDYWLIPARTANADVEWPLDDTTGKPIFQPPLGIHHHYCRLAVLKFDGKNWKVDSDCRRKFPPVTELTSLYYVSGDGQEAMPGNALPNQLQVRVANGQIPVIGATVRFTVLTGSGSLSSVAPAVTTTPDDGIAGCSWTLGPDGSGSQRVSAELLDAAGNPVPGQIVYFNANLSVAENVYYDPKGCESLDDVNVNNVQDALERLSKLRTISYVGGDGQDAVPGEWLAKPLEVRVVSKCGPAAGAKVVFTPVDSSGRVAANKDSSPVVSFVATTGSDGIASCVWKPGNDLNKPVQELTAVLDEASTDLVQEPKSIRFTANLSIAENVYYKPGCDKLKDKTTVQAAIDELCRIMPEPQGGCMVPVGPGGQFDTLQDALVELQNSGITDIRICLLPGSHNLTSLDINVNTIKVVGCGASSVVNLVNKAKLSLNAGQILFQDFLVSAKTEAQLILVGHDVTVERCGFIRVIEMQAPFVLIKPVSEEVTTFLRWKSNRVASTWVASDPQLGWSYLSPAKAVMITTNQRKNLDLLSIIDPYKEREEYDKALKAAVKDITSFSLAIRQDWYNRRSKAKINSLDPLQKKAVMNFYNEIKKETIKSDKIEKLFVDVGKTFKKTKHAVALALADGVGGWIEDNVINGYLALHYRDNFKPLYWNKNIKKDERGDLQDWADKNIYLDVEQVSLIMRGNAIYTVLSNGSKILPVIEAIIKKVDLPGGITLERCYKSLSVVENIFQTHYNSFISYLTIMNGNTFSGPLIVDDNAAYVLGNTGIFMGNAAADSSIRIDKILKSGKMREAANFMTII